MLDALQIKYASKIETRRGERQNYARQTRLWFRELDEIRQEAACARSRPVSANKASRKDHAILVGRYRQARGEQIKWQDIADKTIEENRLLRGEVCALRKRFCDAQISAAYTGKRHLDAEVSLSALKYAAMETERAVVLGYLSKCGALLEELEAQKLQTAVIRRQVVDLRQELSGVRRQLALHATERGEVVQQALFSSRGGYSTKQGMPCTFGMLSLQQRVCWAGLGAVSPFQMRRGASPNARADSNPRPKIENGREKVRSAALPKESNFKASEVAKQQTKSDSMRIVQFAQNVVSGQIPRALSFKKLRITRKAGATRKAHQQLANDARSLTDRCVYLQHQICAALSAECRWREERILLLSSARMFDLAIKELYANSAKKDATKGMFDMKRVSAFDVHAEHAASKWPMASDAHRFASRGCISAISDANKACQFVETNTRHDSLSEKRVEVLGDCTDLDPLDSMGLQGFILHIKDIMANEVTGITDPGMKGGKLLISQELIATKLNKVFAYMRNFGTVAARECTELRALLAVNEAQTSQEGAMLKRDAAADIHQNQAVLQYIYATCLHCAQACGTHLLRLELPCMRLSDDAALLIVRLLAGMPRIKCSLSAYPVADHIMQGQKPSLHAPHNFRPHNWLSHLILRDNALGDVAAAALAINIVSIAPILAYVDLKNNQISSSGRQTLKIGTEANKSVLETSSFSHDDCNMRLREEALGPIICGWREHENWTIERVGAEIARLEQPGSHYLGILSGMLVDPHVHAPPPLLVDLRGNTPIVTVFKKKR